MDDTPKERSNPPRHTAVSRRTFTKALAVGLGATAVPAAGAGAFDWDVFLQKHFREMTDNEITRTVERLERQASRRWRKNVRISTVKATPGVLFGYGLDLSKCIGCRRCVYACVEENNQSRNPQVQWISVLRFRKGGKWSDLAGAEKYYTPATVPEPGFFYLPVGCQMCEKPPCVKVCPTGATWREPDGIVVVDYDWCIGCRYCMAACAFGARHFNWADPTIPTDAVNPETHYLGNRPRSKGVVEKCTLCIQRVRAGRYPACVDACPVGARKFGNLLDPSSEIRYLIEHKRVFRLKEDLNTEPKFYYFFSA